MTAIYTSYKPYAKIKGTIIFMLLAINCFAQNNANALISRVNKKFNSVKDYKAAAVIKTDIPFIKMLSVSADIYYKQPDKVHIDTKGIAILPKQTNGFMMDALKDSNTFMAIDAGNTIVNNIQVHIIKVLPTSDTSDLILGTFYIEDKTSLIHKAQITSKSRGTVDVMMKYGQYANYNLPDTIIFEMDVNKFKIPKAVAADLENNSKKDTDKKPKKGKVTITYKNYSINKGISDAVFSK